MMPRYEQLMHAVIGLCLQFNIMCKMPDLVVSAPRPKPYLEMSAKHKTSKSMA